MSETHTLLERTAEALRRRGFEAAVFATAAQASEFLLADMPAGQTVALGGSMTAKEMNLPQLLREHGHAVLWHWEVAPAGRPALLHEAMNAPVYVCSANAVTTDGLMVNIDGNGNRVAAMCYGPNTVYVVIGRNKLVEGGYAQAVRRIKEVACPKNARRQGLDTPCAAEGGACRPLECAHSMCHITASFERAPGGKRTVVLLIDEDLGY